MKKEEKMIYKEFKDKKLSALGFGAMRLPIINGNYSRIDEKKTLEMIDYAISKGINYFDTAWGYHDGNSEIIMGKILSQYPRERYYLATKFPGYDLSNMTKVEEIFETQLKKCNVEYFDFYLFHNVCEMNIDAYLDEKYGVFKYLMKQKNEGRIHHLGFSTHGSYSTVKRFLESYGDSMEFAQIQLNYFDWFFQDAKSKVELFKEYSIPIWVMEPLRGGELVSLSKDHTEKLKKLRPNESVVAWAFRFLQSIPEVNMVLSGMSNLQQLEENIKIFEKNRPLNEEELATLLNISKEIIGINGVPCTKCRYCIEQCPQELDIPYLIELYNEYSFTKDGFDTPTALMALPPEKRPSACISCKSCESVCPQQINISEILANFSKKVGG
jgi:predicted aldo/keto reductase-like oxidoreductase